MRNVLSPQQGLFKGQSQFLGSEIKCYLNEIN